MHRSIAVHPRVCGERVVSASLDRFAAGSSPRVRGTLCQRQDQYPHARFIPACAGNASKSRCRKRRARGSSPRVRGTRDRVRVDALGHRFIPACAGNAWRPALRPRGRSVHPRVCGERTIRCGPCVIDIGSSPRVRGTQLARFRVELDRRFIPACAGNARASPTPPPRHAVHPRVCGERLRRSGVRDIPIGSSPRVRGTPAFTLSPPHCSRFIPACAGNAPEPGP